jgi:Family of unknown function (DUF6113)
VNSQSPATGGRQALISVGAYLMLFLLGLLIGMIGSFQYDRGPAPLAAIGFDLLILAVCALGSHGMRAPGGGMLPALGWFIAAVLLSLGTSSGSVIITDTAAGKWFLFGGAACAAVGGVYAYARWSRTAAAARAARRGR